MRVLRVYHGGRDPAHRARDRALVESGVDLTLVVPDEWPEGGAEASVGDESLSITELSVTRAGDVNRHAYKDAHVLAALIRDVRPDVLDIHEEPVSLAARQWLGAAPASMPIVMYTAQNVDKRFPPPFAQYEQRAYRRLAGMYPCSSQAASVARGKGFAGLVEVIPLGYDETLFVPGVQSLDDDEIVLGLFGRLEPEKGVADAVRIAAQINRIRPARLVIAGSGPEERTARALSEALDIADRVQIHPWLSTADLARTYRESHVVLVPSRATETWVEQFGRVIVEAQASGALVAGYASGSIAEVAGRAALLSPVGDVSGLADRIVTVLADPGAYADHRGRGIELSRGRTWRDVAEKQVDLYRRVATADRVRVSLPSSPRSRRAAARAEFGSTAATTAGMRPFALPVLRRGGSGPETLSRVLDCLSELASRARPRSASLR